MNPIQVIVYNEKHILLMDFTDNKTTAEITQNVSEIKKTVELHPPGSLLALLDVTGVVVNKERIAIIQGMAAHTLPYISFIAIVGLEFFRAAMFRIMLWLSGRKNHKVFRKRENALKWLGEK